MIDVDKYIEDCLGQEEPTEADVERLQGWMASTSFKKVAGLLAQEINGKLNSLAQTPLTSQDKIMEAATVQGEIAGMRRWFSLIFDETDRLKEDEDDEENRNE